MPSAFVSHPAGVALHVVCRGYDRKACFFGPRDREAFLRSLASGSARFGCAVHAYVLMGNHIHLLMTAGERTGSGRLLETICASHAKLIGETHGTGPVWDARIETSQVHARKHLLACMRYIELNPVRARIVTRPTAFRWSSFRANAFGSHDPLVSPHPYYYALGRCPEERQRAYLKLFDRIGQENEHVSATIRAFGIKGG